MKTMDIENWKLFPEKLPLEPLFVGYIGGFEPLNMKKLEVKTIGNKLIHNFVRILMVLFSFRMQFLRRFNSKFMSGYLVGMYRKKQVWNLPGLSQILLKIRNWIYPDKKCCLSFKSQSPQKMVAIEFKMKEPKYLKNIFLWLLPSSFAGIT